MNNEELTLWDALLSGDTSGAINRNEKREQCNTIKNQRIPIKTNDHAVPRDISFIGIDDDMEDDMEWEERLKIMKINNINWTKEQYEKMGINIVNKYDDLFFNVELPEGWEVKATDHSMWNDVVDNMGRKRITFFYKGAFYDKDAFSNFERRFHISSKKADYDENKYEQQPEYIQTGETKRVYIDKNGNEVKVEDINITFWENDYDFRRGSSLIKEYEQIERPLYKKNPDYIKLTGYEKYSQPFHYEVYDFDGKTLFKSDVVKTECEYSNYIHSEFFAHLKEVENKAQEQCEEWLQTNYPDWKNFHAYWND